MQCASARNSGAAPHPDDARRAPAMMVVMKLNDRILLHEVKVSGVGRTGQRIDASASIRNPLAVDVCFIFAVEHRPGGQT